MRIFNEFSLSVWGRGFLNISLSSTVDSQYEYAVVKKLQRPNPWHSMNGLGLKSSRHDPGLTNDWPPPSAPASVCYREYNNHKLITYFTQFVYLILNNNISNTIVCNSFQKIINWPMVFTVYSYVKRRLDQLIKIYCIKWKIIQVGWQLGLYSLYSIKRSVNLLKRQNCCRN